VAGKGFLVIDPPQPHGFQFVVKSPIILTAATSFSRNIEDAKALNFKDDRQRFSWKVSKKQFLTVYYNANTWMNNIAKC